MAGIKKTKIICTIGPASENKKVLTEMVKSGMDIMRMNFSHGSHEEHQKKIDLIREINKELNSNVSILLDTKGPEIRTGDFENGCVEFKKNTDITIVYKDVVGTSTQFSITYKELYKDVQKGTHILVNDGAIDLMVKEIVDKENKEIDNFNIDYFNFYDRINNTTTNYNNTNDKLHLLNKFNNFDIKETNNKTIREIYNQIVN